MKIQKPGRVAGPARTLWGLVSIILVVRDFLEKCLPAEDQGQGEEELSDVSCGLGSFDAGDDHVCEC